MGRMTVLEQVSQYLNLKEHKSGLTYYEEEKHTVYEYYQLVNFRFIPLMKINNDNKSDSDRATQQNLKCYEYPLVTSVYF